MVKVCGMTLSAQVAALDSLGVDFLGFIFAAKSPRRVTPEHVASIPRGRAKRVGVFVEQDAAEVRRIMDAAGLDLAQLHGGQDERFCEAVGPDRVVRVFWPERHARALAEAGLDADAARVRASLEAEMARFAGACALMLLDAGTSGGGHGTSLDFAGLAGLHAPRPWLLAGGLSPANAARAVREASPAGLDLNSGVEDAPGVKNLDMTKKTLNIIKSF
ncbi:phosphoribosylanthranilate isomerase [Fundidesulfovibrio magnetotacticus]|uniref:phosphoribosylanthranilate isomerase n=1 Tax=Fundidesulfovibrio magnetotacticus TaxID=2730080 RepID=UPI0035317B12